MKKLLLIFLASAAVLSITYLIYHQLQLNCARGTGNVVSQWRQLGAFDAIEASDGVTVYVTQDFGGDATVEAEDNVVGHVEAETSLGVLNVRIRGCAFKTKPVTVKVSAGRIKRLSASSSARIIVSPELHAEEISLYATKSGKIDLTVSAKRIRVWASEYGTINVGGYAEDLSAHAEKSGSVYALNMAADSADVSADSYGVVQVHATEKLTARADTHGRVYYAGQSAVTKQESTSGIVLKSR